MPLDLAAGDRVLIRNTGAYTSTYSSVCFNGFAPLAVVVICTGAAFGIRLYAANPF